MENVKYNIRKEKLSWWLHLIQLLSIAVAAEVQNASNQMNEEIKRLNKVVDKLEQRIATLEKVLASHAKCIGEMRENKNE